VGEFQPAWSPDGRWIAYVTWSAEGGHLWKLPAGGGEPERLTRVPAFYSDPAWAPDGRRIVALRGTVHERVHREFDLDPLTGLDLVWIPAGGGDANLVVPARGLGKPHFTHDAERIFVYLNTGFGRDTQGGLVSLRFDGTDRREHLKVTGPGYYLHEKPIPADDVRVSPDGKWALAHVANQLYVTAVPRMGGEPPVVDLDKPTLPLAKLTDIGADYFGWADDGATVTWAVGATFFRQPFDSISFEPEAEDDGQGDDEAAGGKAGKKRDKGAPGKKEEKKKGPPPYEALDIVVETPRQTPQGTVVLRGATLIPMTGEQVIANGDLRVDGNRIAALGPAGSVTIPPGARVIDARGTTIVPGFVDTHAHWFEIRRGVLDLQNWSFLANLAYGVTAGLDVQTMTNDMFAYQDLVEAGRILGPRAYSTGPGIFSNNKFDSIDDVRGVLTRYKTYYRTHNLKSYIVGNRKRRQWVVEVSRELSMMPTTEGALDLKLDLTHVLDGFSGSEHALPIVPLFADVVELFARSGVGYTPTLLVTYGGPFAEHHFYTTEEVHDDPKLNRFTPHGILDQKTRRRPWFRHDEHVYPQIAAQAAKIIRAGGRVGIGSHGQLQGLGYHWEMWALAAGGLEPLEVLRAATLHGAEMIGYADDLGSLEPGKLADLLVLERNPLDDIANTNAIRFVMKNGELFEADTLRQIWPRERELEPLWWWDEGPAPAATP
jgi:imidazolonepropionase-like amidohydrolase